MITSCCSRLEEVNGVVILRHLLNNYIYSRAEFIFLSFTLPLAGIDPNSGSIPAHAPDSPQETSYDRLHPASASSYWFPLSSSEENKRSRNWQSLKQKKQSSCPAISCSAGSYALGLYYCVFNLFYFLFEPFFFSFQLFLFSVNFLSPVFNLSGCQAAPNIYFLFRG